MGMTVLRDVISIVKIRFKEIKFAKNFKCVLAVFKVLTIGAIILSK